MDAARRRAAIIDDEEDVRLYLATALEDSGFEVQCAHDVDSGLEMLKIFQPDIVCLDLLMPGRSGLTLYREIKERAELAECAVLIVSGLGPDAA